MRFDPYYLYRQERIPDYEGGFTEEDPNRGRIVYLYVDFHGETVTAHANNQTDILIGDQIVIDGAHYTVDIILQSTGERYKRLTLSRSNVPINPNVP